MDTVREIAPAKVNLSLEVIGKYEDGYHKLESIMQSVNLCDELILTAAGEKIELTLDGDYPVPDDSSNLVWQAAELMKKKFNRVSSGLQIKLHKKIPVSAGLGGGSSDAAAVIRAINRLFSLGLTAPAMEKLALKLGADVPFCIRGGTAFARGRGGKLTFLPTPSPDKHSLILIKPGFSAATEEIFARVSSEVYTRETDSDRLINLLLSDRDVDWTEGWKNDLEQITFSLYPSLLEVKKKISEFCPQHILMTGSGPTLMAFFVKTSRALEMLNNWSGKEKIFLVNFLSSAKTNNSV